MSERPPVSRKEAIILCDAVWAWETWAYLHDTIGLQRLNVVFYEHYQDHKVPRCPACEAGIPTRVVQR